MLSCSGLIRQYSVVSSKVKGKLCMWQFCVTLQVTALLDTWRINLFNRGTGNDSDVKW